MNILDKIIISKRREVEALSRAGYYDAITAMPRQEVPSMVKAIKGSQTGIIAEYKRRSPSVGLINGVAQVEEVIAGYIAAGVAACSVLTDTPYFGGAATDLVRARAVAREAGVPLLRKDFIISPLQIDEARALGASAVLLIAAALKRDELKALSAHAHECGLETLIEVHNVRELARALGATPDMLGVNSRNLTDMTVDLTRTTDLAAAIGQMDGKIPLVAESGIYSANDVATFRRDGYSAFLIGQRFMASDDPASACASFVKTLNNQA